MRPGSHTVEKHRGSLNQPAPGGNKMTMIYVVGVILVGLILSALASVDDASA